MSRAFTESVVEEVVLAWLHAAGWKLAHGPEIAPDTPARPAPSLQLANSRVAN
jgi:hypothetical protein